jgi:hypothetical protein
MSLVPFDDEEEPEAGLNLDNDSLVVTGDQGIPIQDFHGHKATLSHEEQQRMRQTFGCGHKNTKLTVMAMVAGNGYMAYKCADCGTTIIEGHVTNFEYRKEALPDEFNNPFLTGKH